MYILMLVIAGLLVLAAFVAVARATRRSPAAASGVFIWVWLVVAVLNGWIGVVYADAPIVNEVAAFIPIFAVPAAAAGYAARRFGARRASPAVRPATTPHLTDDTA
jgi:apolipoprotein N-acyltransferase